MKKNIRLTESDLIRLVRRVIMEERGVIKEGVLVVTKLADFKEGNKKGYYEVYNGRFYITDANGQRTEVIEC